MMTNRGWMRSLTLIGMGTLAATGALVVADGIACVQAAESTVAAWRAQRGPCAQRLEEHAAWCATQKLRRERHEAYAGLLLLRPDHAKARRVLKYVAGPNGTWVRKSYRVPGRSRDAAKAQEAGRRLAEVASLLREATIALRDDQSVSLLDRGRAVAELAVILPNDEEVRAWNGEVRLGKHWVLRETATALKEGKVLRADMLQILADQSQPNDIEPDDDDAPFVKKFADGSENDAVRVLAMRGAASSVEAARVFAAAHGAFARALGSPPFPPMRVRVFLFGSKEDGLEVFAKHPSVDEAYLAWARTLASVWTPSGDVIFIWASDEPRAIEWCLRQALQMHLRQTLDVNAKRGWAYEGMGQWLSETMLGSHLSWYVRRDGYTNQSGARGERFARMLDPKHNWFELGLELASTDDWPDLRIVLGRDVNSMTAEDVLASYLLTRFLLEGRPDDAHAILSDVGAATAPDAWCANRLGLSLEQLDARLRRWMSEVASRAR